MPFLFSSCNVRCQPFYAHACTYAPSFFLEPQTGIMTVNDTATLPDANGGRPCPESGLGEGSGPGLDTDFLIVGGGPAGASLACFLASYGD